MIKDPTTDGGGQFPENLSYGHHLIGEGEAGHNPTVTDVFVDLPSEYFNQPHQLIKESGRTLLLAVDADRAATYSKSEIFDILRQNGIETDDVMAGITVLRANSEEDDSLKANEGEKEITKEDETVLLLAEQKFVDYFETKERAEQEALALLGNKEDDIGTQVEALSRREKNLVAVARAIRNGTGKEVLDEHLFYYRREPVVIQFVIDDLLAQIVKKEAGDTKALDGIPNWRWEIGKTNETIAKQMRESLLHGGPTEKTIHTPAFEQLKMHDFSYHEGLDDPASFTMFETLRENLRASGMTNQQISDAIEEQKDITKKSVLFPEDIIAIQRRKVGTRASKDIPGITTEEEEVAKKLPPLIFTPEIEEVTTAPVQASKDELVVAMDSSKPNGESAIIVPPPAKIEVDFPVLTDVVEQEPKDQTVAPQAGSVGAVEPAESAVIPDAGLTPNQIFSKQMRVLEHDAEQLARKSALSQDEKVKLSALEKEMNKLEASYLASRTNQSIVKGDTVVTMVEQPPDIHEGKETDAELRRQRTDRYNEKLSAIRSALLLEHGLTKEEMEDSDAEDGSWTRIVKEAYIKEICPEAIILIEQLKDPALSKEDFFKTIKEFDERTTGKGISTGKDGIHETLSWKTPNGRNIEFYWSISEGGYSLGGSINESDTSYEIPGAWNPEAELEKIKSAPKSERRELLEKYKEQLRVQQEGITKMQEVLVAEIRTNPDMEFEEFEAKVIAKIEALHLSITQVTPIFNSFKEYQAKHQAVERYFEQYPLPDRLYEAAFGRTPKGKIEVIKGPMTLYFRCHNNEDYALIYSGKLSQPSAVDAKDVDLANKSGGCALVTSKIPELYGALIAERAEGREFIGYPVSTYEHEEQHALNGVMRTKQESLFNRKKNYIETEELITQLEEVAGLAGGGASLEGEIRESQVEKIIDNIMRNERRRLRAARGESEARAADEILAFIRDGSALPNVYATLIRKENDGGLYDYFHQKGFSVQNPIEKYLNDDSSLSKQHSERLKNEWKELYDDVFGAEYQEELRSGLTAYKKLREANYSEEMIRSVFQHEPLARWEKVANRLTERALGITETVEDKFEQELGVGYEQLKQIEGFRSLSEGQQLLVLRNRQNEVLQNVEKEADKEQKAEWKGRSLWGKIWHGARTMGTYQSMRTKDIEKELLARAKGKVSTDPKRAEILAEHIANIEEYVKVAGTGPDVLVKEDGTLEVKYASLKKVLGSFEVVSATSEDVAKVESFNTAATAFAKLPREWGYEPKDEKEKGQREQYDAEKAKYDVARAELLLVYKAKFAEKGEVDPEKAALLEMNRIDETMVTSQLFNAHPNAQEALEKIENQSAILAGVKEFWRDKGKYLAIGAATRAGVIGVAAVTGAFTGGLGALAVAGGVGAGVGGFQGAAEAKKVIRQRRIDRRLSEQDEREEISYKDSNGTSHIRKIKEHTDATVFVDRIERLTDKLDEAETEEERSLLESKIAKTTALAEEKFKRGLINFGGSSLESTDPRRGNDIANKLSFMQAIGKGAAIEIVDPKKLKNEIQRITTSVSTHQDRIEEVRNEEVIKVGMKAAMMRGGFALGGSYIAGKVHESGIADAVFAKFAKLKEEAVIAAVASPESGIYLGTDIERVRSSVFAYVNPKLPKEFVEGENAAIAKALAEYMSAKDSATRTAIAETMGMSEKEINERIATILTKGASVAPEGAVAKVAATQPAASAPTPASAPPLSEARPAVATPVPQVPPAPTVSPASPTQASGVYVPPKLVGGPGAELHQPTPDGGVPQKGWEDIAVPRVHHNSPAPTLPQEQKVIPVPQAEPLPPKWTGESAPRTKLPPPPWEVLTDPSKITAPDVAPFPRTLPITPNEKVLPPLPPETMNPTLRAVPLNSFSQEGIRDGAVNTPRMETIADSTAKIEKPVPIFTMNEAEAAAHTKIIADKWSLVAKEGTSKNPYWSEARDQIALMFEKVPRAQGGAPGTIQEAYAQMQSMVRKAEGMGFAPSEKEGAGTFIDRVAKELHEPLTEKSLVSRSAHIHEELLKNLPLRTKIGSTLSAARIMGGGKDLPGDLSPDEQHDVLVLRRVLERMTENTGVKPTLFPSFDEFITQTIQKQLKKTPTLHMNSLLAPKDVMPLPRPLNAPTLVPSPLPVPKPPLRWDQQA